MVVATWLIKTTPTAIDHFSEAAKAYDEKNQTAYTENVSAYSQDWLIDSVTK